MNAGQVAAIVVLIGGFYFIRKYVKKRTEREVKVIDKISYPKYDKRQRRERTERRSEGGSTGRTAISIRFGL